MKARQFCHWPVLLPVFLLAAWLGAPSPACAGCGDYVVIGGQAAAEQHQPNAASAPSSHSLPSPQPAPPCHGPMCSGRVPANGPPPVPAPTGPPADEWGAPGAREEAGAPGPSRQPCDPPVPLPGSVPSAIYHPPRVTAPLPA